MDYPIVEIIWRDAECDPEWKKIDKISKGNLPIVYTIGYLLHEDKEKYIVASTIGDDEATATMMIPVDWVTKISLITF
ncbi:hypothetical protein LCGC14_1933720 [marine sediment metagenome]|uniref:Uncharacterized protein n=1 Tax=marine sediment metagenome TaxID=412755 RepID=A0A0F9FMT0_9ZZZZ